MTVNPVVPPRGAEPVSQQAAPRPARDIADRFAAAVRQGAAPLSKWSSPTVAAVDLVPRTLPATPGGPVTAVEATSRRLRLDPEMPDLALAAGALAAPAGAFAIAPPPATIDPSAFADLMNQLWLREQHKTTREVRVRFGDAAWPATGARLTRLDNGSLDIEVSIGRHARGGDIDVLRANLAARGLPVASVVIAEDS
jgi:hypothetical protein